MLYLRNLKAGDLKNKVCLLRLDFNTEDNWRLLASLPTLKFLASHCRATVILSHKGRPFGEAQGKPFGEAQDKPFGEAQDKPFGEAQGKPSGFQKSLSLKPLVKDLRRLLKKPVAFLPHFRFLEIKKLISASPAKSVFLLENLRFLKEEAENNKVLAKNLATLGDIYINDAFAVSHRANASVTAITEFLPSYAGLELEAEIKNLSRVMKNPAQPLIVILGGLKIEDKLGVVKNLENKTQAFLIGGALNKKILRRLAKYKKIILPIDFKYENGVIKDINSKTTRLFTAEIKKAGTVIWNGPVGDINKKQFENGTKKIAKAVAANKKAYKIVGGGETVMFLKKMKLDKKIDFISTGGGAMLEFLAGKKLPGIKALE